MGKELQKTENSVNLRTRERKFQNVVLKKYFCYTESLITICFYLYSDLVVGTHFIGINFTLKLPEKGHWVPG